MPNKIFKKKRLKLLVLLPTALTFFNYSCGPYNRSMELNYSCHGVVVKKLIDYDNHATHTLWVKGMGGLNDICCVTSFGADSVYLYNKVSVGDSIIKKPGSKLYHVKSSEKDYFYECVYLDSL